MKRLMTVLLCLSIAALLAPPAHAAAATPAAKLVDAKAVPATADAKPVEAKIVPASPALPDSVVMLEKAVARDSSNFDNLYRLGVMYLDRDKVVEAAKVLTRAHVLKPQDHKVCVNLGVALDANGKPDEAQVYYREALAAFPEDSVASCRLASSLYSQSKHAEAVALLQQIIQKSPRAYCAYFTLGVAFADAGIYKDAIRMWRKVVDLAPSSPEAISARESIDVLEKFVGQ